MEFNAANNNKAVQVDLYDGTLSVADSLQQTNNNANWFVFSGFHYFIAGAAAQTFTLRYRISTSGTTCGVRNAALELWRVE